MCRACFCMLTKIGMVLKLNTWTLNHVSSKSWGCLTTQGHLQLPRGHMLKLDVIDSLITSTCRNVEGARKQRQSHKVIPRMEQGCIPITTTLKPISHHTFKTTEPSIVLRNHVVHYLTMSGPLVWDSRWWKMDRQKFIHRPNKMVLPKFYPFHNKDII